MSTRSFRLWKRRYERLRQTKMLRTTTSYQALVANPIDLGERGLDMGGYGSGYRGTKAEIVEDCLVLSIFDLFQKGALVPGSRRCCRLAWCTEDIEHAEIEIETDLIDESHGTVRLRYAVAGEDIDTWIWLTTTTPRFGGRRWWFRCPETNRRVAKLYLPPDETRFASRQAYGLSYRSCQESDGRSLERWLAFCERVRRRQRGTFKAN
jgi:hypothetical protein